MYRALENKSIVFYLVFCEICTKESVRQTQVKENNLYETKLVSCD